MRYSDYRRGRLGEGSHSSIDRMSRAARERRCCLRAISKPPAIPHVMRAQPWNGRMATRLCVLRCVARALGCSSASKLSFSLLCPEPQSTSHNWAAPALKLLNAGQDCWSACGGSGACRWCGTGRCCRKDWNGGENGCFVQEGGEGKHICVAGGPSPCPWPSPAPRSSVVFHWRGAI